MIWGGYIFDLISCSLSATFVHEHTLSSTFVHAQLFQDPPQNERNHPSHQYVETVRCAFSPAPPRQSPHYGPHYPLEHPAVSHVSTAWHRPKRSFVAPSTKCCLDRKGKRSDSPDVVDGFTLTLISHVITRLNMSSHISTCHHTSQHVSTCLTLIFHPFSLSSFLPFFFSPVARTPLLDHAQEPRVPTVPSSWVHIPHNIHKDHSRGLPRFPIGCPRPAAAWPA